MSRRPTSRRSSRIRKAAAAGLLSTVAAGSLFAMTGTAHAYEARITKQDLKDAGAKLTTGGYVLGNRTYHCGATGYCSVA